MATKTGLTKNEKIALGVGGAAVVALIGLHLYNQSRVSQTVTNDGLTVKQIGATTLDISYTNSGSSVEGSPFFQIWIFGPGLGNGVIWQTTQAYSSTPAPPPIGTGNVSSNGNTVTWTGVNLASLGGQNGTYTIKGEKGMWINVNGVNGMADFGNTEVNITISTIGNVSWWQMI